MNELSKNVKTALNTYWDAARVADAARAACAAAIDDCAQKDAAKALRAANAVVKAARAAHKIATAANNAVTMPKLWFTRTHIKTKTAFPNIFSDKNCRGWSKTPIQDIPALVIHRIAILNARMPDQWVYKIQGWK